MKAKGREQLQREAEKLRPYALLWSYEPFQELWVKPMQESLERVESVLAGDGKHVNTVCRELALKTPESREESIDLILGCRSVLHFWRRRISLVGDYAKKYHETNKELMDLERGTGTHGRLG